MAARLDPIWWRFSVGGEVKVSGNDYAKLSVHASLWLCEPRLVITGSESGIGKTSLAVAMMQYEIDRAKRHCLENLGDNETTMAHAEQSRFVAAIDTGDPMHARMAHTASLAVIDDAGQEGRCGGFRGQDRYAAVGDLLDRRERNPKRRTIVTTFGTREQWGTWYGGRVVRLYWDMPTAAVLEMRRAE